MRIANEQLLLTGALGEMFKCDIIMKSVMVRELEGRGYHRHRRSFKGAPVRWQRRQQRLRKQPAAHRSLLKEHC